MFRSQWEKTKRFFSHGDDEREAELPPTLVWVIAFVLLVVGMVLAVVF